MIYGRNRERSQLRELLDDAIAGHGSLVLISGEAGIGKTTLVDDLIHQAEQHRCLVLSGGCYDLTTTPPYGPWIEVLEDYQPGDSGPQLPPWFGSPEELEQVGSQARLFEETRSFFASVAEQQPLMIVLEDLHWSDTASLDALRYMARQLAGGPVLLVATYRDDEITRRHQLSRMLPAIVRESSAARLNLSTLDDGAVRELIMDRYDLSPHDLERLSDHISDLAEGNSLYVVELLQTLEDVGSLQVEDDRAEVGALDRVVVPPLIGQLIEERLERLDPDAANLLEIASVIGQEFDFELWSDVSDAGDDLLFNTLETALRRRLIEETDHNGRYRFTHALIREALYERQIWPRRRQQHRTIAESLEVRPQPSPDIVAFHYQMAEEYRAARWLSKAGKQAEQAFAWMSAVERYEAAAKLLKPRPEDRSEYCRLLADTARLLRFDDPERGLQYLEEALEHAQIADDKELVGACLLQRGILRTHIADVEGGVDDVLDGLAILEEAGRIEAIEDRLGSSIRGSVGLLLSNTGRLQESLDFWERYFAENSKQIETWGNALGRTYAMLGRPDEARKICNEMLSAAEARSHILNALSAAVSEVAFVAIPFYFDDVGYRKTTWDRYREFQMAGSGFSTHPLNLLAPPPDGPGFMGSSDWDTWRRWQTNISSFGYSFWGHYGCAMMGVLSRLQGDTKSALVQVPAVLTLGTSTRPGSTPSFYSSTILQCLAADLALDNLDLEEARSWLEAHDHWMEWSGAVLGLAEGQLGWARYHRVAGDLPKSREHAERAHEHASGPRQPLALIAADRFLGQLDVDEENWDEAEGHLDASLALAERCEAPFEQALTLVVMAELAAKLGEVNEARRLIRRVWEICEPLGAKPTLERVDEIEATLPRTRRSSTDHPFGLSGREIEVLRLVARGRTDAEAAKELFISPRTVSQHLRNAYNKIGVNNRAEATRMAVEAGIV